MKSKDQFNRDITEERTQIHHFNATTVKNNYKNVKNRQRYSSFYFFKCMQGSGRGVDDDMFNVLYLIRASEL